MVTNTAITLYNAYNDSETGCIKYARTTVQGCSWYCRQLIRTGGSIASSNNDIQIRIPVSAVIEHNRRFVHPTAWKKLGDDQRITHWTIQPGDKVVRAETPCEISKQAQLSETFDQVATVTGWGDNRRGTPRLHHFRIEGK